MTRPAMAGRRSGHLATGIRSPAGPQQAATTRRGAPLDNPDGTPPVLHRNGPLQNGIQIDGWRFANLVPLDDRYAMPAELDGVAPAELDEAPPPRRPTRNKRAKYPPAPAGDRFTKTPTVLTRPADRSKTSPWCSVIFDELMLQVFEAPRAKRSLGRCDVTVGVLAANTGAGERTVRRVLVELERLDLIRYGRRADGFGLRVEVLWTGPG